MLAQTSSISFSYDPAGLVTIDVGQTHDNTVTASGHDDEDAPVSDTDDHSIAATNVAPAITVTKDGPATIAEGGANVVYNSMLTNNSVSTDPVTITSLADNTFSDADDAGLFAAALAAYQVAHPGATEIVLARTSRSASATIRPGW